MTLPNECEFCGNYEILDSFQNHDIDSECDHWFCNDCLNDIRINSDDSNYCPECGENINFLVQSSGDLDSDDLDSDDLEESEKKD